MQWSRFSISENALGMLYLLLYPPQHRLSNSVLTLAALPQPQIILAASALELDKAMVRQVAEEGRSW